jgi:RNA polymerase sigma-70 factor (ECF subfamily)
MDASIVRRAQRGDEQAFAVMADAVLDRFLGVAERILRDPQLAEDATQQALINVWRFLPDLRDPDRFDAWAYRLLVKVCYSQSRQRSRWKSDVPLQDTDRRTVPDSLMGLAERDRIERGLRRISVEHRTVLALHYYVDLPLEQIATALDVPVGTVKSRIHRAQRSLRSVLEADARQADPSLSPEAIK